MQASTGTHIDNPVGHPNRILVMFHNNQRIANIPQTLQGLNEFMVVPLVQTDGRFIQHIENSHQVGSNLGRKADTLCLTTREASGTSGKRQISQAHFFKKRQT